MPASHSKHAPAIHPVDSGHPQSTIPATVSLPPMTIPVPGPVMFAPPPVSAPGQGINCPIEIEEYKNRRGLGFRHSCHEIIEARRGKHLHRLAAFYGKVNWGIPVLPLSHFFLAPPHIVGGTLDGPSLVSDAEPVDPPAICAVTEETPLGVHIRLAQENEELNNWTSVPCYSAVITDV
ncbi:hypothetical protein CDL15_Pgr027374 [Punica granatum]|uniref:Uncharacterized protein n=1 Tax=Punica granatum TaxID=22663 RepID=A0A218Y0N7_PUNGR|nr:hypothetical protein CDL15_Pgr027374 [Punica granatum]